MRFNPRARLNTSRVRDAGGSGGGFPGGGMQIPIPGGMKGGGGAGIVVVLILLFLFRSCTGTDLTGGLTGSGGLPVDTSRVGSDTDRYANCLTGEDANNDVDCARIAVENSLVDFWEQTWDEQVSGGDFRPAAAMVTFTGGVQTACGQASSEMGPFYCPGDESIYLDTTFFSAVLERELDGPSGAFVEPYVLAHEYGHHVQKLLGYMNRVRTQRGPESDAVRLELQADCLAGMWAGAATRTEDEGGQALFTELTDEDIRQAIAAADAVGDDQIQEKVGGRVNPEQWTHGSSEQRQRWFLIGMQEQSLKACDTFEASSL